jgi:hypothetical protein
MHLMRYPRTEGTVASDAVSRLADKSLHKGWGGAGLFHGHSEVAPDPLWKQEA